MHPITLASLGLLSLVLVCQDPTPVPPSPSPGVAQLQRLAWLAGTWVIEADGITTEEHWQPPQGSTMLGMSHTFDATKTRGFEFLRIAVKDGQLAYLAMPGGAPATTFGLSKLDQGVVEFENAEHDHPQRIRYEETPAGVTATISQLDGSRRQAFVFKKK